MLNNVGYKIKVVAVVVSIIMISILVLCAVASTILFISGNIGRLSLKLVIIGTLGAFLICFFCLLLFGFGHIIELNEEQAVLLRRIAEDEVSSYERNNNVFIE